MIKLSSIGMSNTTSSINATKHTVNPFEATPIKAHKKLLKFVTAFS